LLFGAYLDILFSKWFPIFDVPSPRTTIQEKPVSPTNQERQVAQQRQVSPKPVTREQFLKERRPSPLPTCQSH